MGAHVEKASRIGGPLNTGDSATGNPVRVAATGASQSVAFVAASGIPGKKSVIAGLFLKIKPVGCSIQYTEYQGSAPTIVSNQTSTFASPGSGTGVSLADGESNEFIVDPLAVGVALIASNSTGFIEFYVSERAG